MLDHNDDIHCLAIDPTLKFCATGQIGANPWICVYDVSTMEVVARLNGRHFTKGIKQICFSKDGTMIAASCLDPMHMIVIYKWKTPLEPGQSLVPICVGIGSKSNILSIGFNPQDNQLITTGVREVKFFSFD
jgi:WD40 repeat protein